MSVVTATETVSGNCKFISSADVTICNSTVFGEFVMSSKGKVVTPGSSGFFCSNGYRLRPSRNEKLIDSRIVTTGTVSGHTVELIVDGDSPYNLILTKPVTNPEPFTFGAVASLAIGIGLGIILIAVNETYQYMKK